MRTLPLAKLSPSCSIQPTSRLASNCVSRARAATRPSVENNAAGGALEFSERRIDQSLDLRLTRSVRNEQPCERADLHHLVLIPRSLQPGIFFIHLEEFIRGFRS